MNTLLALGILLISVTFGLLAIAMVILVMGFAGAPGALLLEVGKKMQNSFLCVSGFILAAFGQAYIVGAYATFMVALLYKFSAAIPGMPTWPLWIAAFFHSGAAPTYAMKERAERPMAQHYTLGIVASAAILIFFTAIFAPESLIAPYGWVPYFEWLLK